MPNHPTQTLSLRNPIALMLLFLEVYLGYTYKRPLAAHALTQIICLVLHG
jgi:hypothetical protein